jgi:hypothetical protein
MLSCVSRLCCCSACRVLSASRPRAQGYDVVEKLEALGSQGGTPSKEATIADCGVLEA